MDKIRNYINGEWFDLNVANYVDVVNPATGKVIARTPLCAKTEVEAAAKAASDALPAWRRTPAQERVQFLLSCAT